jgi:hypothetical protein
MSTCPGLCPSIIFNFQPHSFQINMLLADGISLACKSNRMHVLKFRSSEPRNANIKNLNWSKYVLYSKHPLCSFYCELQVTTFQVFLLLLSSIFEGFLKTSSISDTQLIHGKYWNVSACKRCAMNHDLLGIAMNAWLVMSPRKPSSMYEF